MEIFVDSCVDSFVDSCVILVSIPSGFRERSQRGTSKPGKATERSEEHTSELQSRP